MKNKLFFMIMVGIQTLCLTSCVQEFDEINHAEKLSGIYFSQYGSYDYEADVPLDLNYYAQIEQQGFMGISITITDGNTTLLPPIIFDYVSLNQGCTKEGTTTIYSLENNGTSVIVNMAQNETTITLENSKILFYGTLNIKPHSGSKALLISGEAFTNIINKQKGDFTNLVFQTKVYKKIPTDATLINTPESEAFIWLSLEGKTLYINTSAEEFIVSDCNRMFFNLAKLNSIVLSNFNTENVTDMEYMFFGCSSLTNLDLSCLSTSNVTNMRYMFYECNKLTSLNLSNFNTSNVTNMEYMFYGCRALTSLNVSSFDTAKVTNMECTFYSCGKLSTLNLSNFDTSNVTNMYCMFYTCNSLTNLNVSSFNTAKVTNMYSMFYYCRYLTTLDLTNFNTANVTDMRSMFDSCFALTSLDLSNFNTANVEQVNAMFYDCNNLAHLNISNFDLSNVSSKRAMFNGFASNIPSCTIVYNSNSVKSTICDNWGFLTDSKFVWSKVEYNK